MASLFVIREKGTGAFCSSSKMRNFSLDLNDAAMFNQRKNAEKACKNMFGTGMNIYGGWSWTISNDEGFTEYHNSHFEEYVSLLETYEDHRDHAKWLRENVSERKCEMEIVEVKLTLV